MTATQIRPASRLSPLVAGIRTAIADKSPYILFTAAGNQPGVASSFALSAVTLIGYTGLLSGPALIGVVARHWSLTAAFAAGIVIMLLICASARRIARHGAG